MKTRLFLRAVSFFYILALAASPVSAVTVTSVAIDDGTGGDYQLAGYGSCFSVIARANPRTQRPEVEVGFEFFTADQSAYDNRFTEDMLGFNWGPGLDSGCTPANISGDPNIPNNLIPNREVVDGTPIDPAVCITERNDPTASPQFFSIVTPWEGSTPQLQLEAFSRRL